MENTNHHDFANLWAVILAAGKGKRMKATTKNKVTYEVAGTPIISRTINILTDASVKNILVVVGFAKQSVIELLPKFVKTVEQRKRLGTGHAVKVAVKKLPQNAKDVLVLYGDDSFLYSPQIFQKLLKIHKEHQAQLTFLTTLADNPTGLGRILRGGNGKVVGVIEEKDATPSQRNIKEINCACYLFSADFLRKYLGKIPKSPVTGEYYLPNLIEQAISHKEQIETLKIDDFRWRGVNTPEELKEAEQLLS